MIHITQPSLALNSADFGIGDHYTMRYNLVVSRAMDMINLRGIILYYLTCVPGDRMNALVINAHGMYDPDGVAIGTGLSSSSLIHLNTNNALRNKFQRIYLASCEIAGSISGQDFCSKLALQLNCEVVASEINQAVTAADRTDLSGATPVIASSQIDEFEGTTYLWNSNGTRGPFSTALSPFVPSVGSTGSCSGRVPGGG